MPATVGSTLVSLATVGLLGTAVLGVAAGDSVSLFAWQISTLALLFTGVVLASHRYLVADRGRSRPTWRFGLQLLLFGMLLAVVYRSSEAGIGFGIHREIEAAVVLLALVLVGLLAGDPRRYTVGQWVVIASYAVVVGVFFVHGLAFSETSVWARYPLWAATVMGLCLLVLPQYVPTETFVRSVSRVSAAVVLIGLPVYLLGEYSLFGVPIRFHGAYAIPYLGYEVPAIRSLFTNRNTFGAVVFAGTVAATADLHRTVIHDRSASTVARRGLPIAGGVLLLGVNALGLALAYGKAPWVVGAASIGIYLAYLAFGRRAIPAAMAGAVAYVVVGILAVYTGVVDVDPSGRFELWGAGVAAILADPTPLGAGLVSTGEYILPYRDGGAPYTVHNSYLSIWIRGGYVAGVAYALVIAASLLRGASRYREVDVAVLAIAVGFAAHQLFEGYTLFHWEITSVLAALSFGFLAFGRAQRVETDRSADSPLGGSSAERR